VVVLVAVVLAARSCGSDESLVAPTTTNGPRVRAPLTGLETDEPLRPALLVKLDNVDAARPQDGLFAADVIFEELVEGGLTRLGAVYSSLDPQLVGPIRSARETDLQLARLLGRPALVFSGGAVPVLSLVADARDEEVLVPVSPAEFPDVFFRRPDKVAPHDLYAVAHDLWAVAEDDASPPDVLFAFGPPAPALPVERFTVSFPSTLVAYRWEPQTRQWLRSQNGADQLDAGRDGAQFGVENVVTLLVQYRPSTTNELSPEVGLGGGLAWVYRDGTVSACRWSIADKPAPRIDLRTDAGQTCSLTPGRTLVELSPTEPAAG
jgi:hypothetical protein